MQRVALINGKNKNKDYDLAKIFKSLATSGVVEGLEVQTGKVITGYAFVDIIRDGVTFPVLFNNSADVIINTTGTTKVFIEITQSNIDDGLINSVDGTGIGEIKTATDYPTTNFVPLASVTGGIITDERVFITTNSSLNLTKQGNIFNGVNQLIKTDSSGKLPALDGSNITGIVAEVKQLTETFIAGEDILKGNSLYQSTINGKVYKTDASDKTKIILLGTANQTVLINENIEVVIDGISNNHTGFITGEDLFLSNTPGMIDNIQGTYLVQVGRAISPTSLLIQNKLKEQPFFYSYNETVYNQGRTLIIPHGFKEKPSHILFYRTGDNGNKISGFWGDDNGIDNYITSVDDINITVYTQITNTNINYVYGWLILP